MDLYDVITISLTAIGVAVALATLIKALFEYQKRGVTERSKIFLEMRTRLREDAQFSEICNLLETDNPRLRDVPLVEKDRFLGFFEELYLLKNSGLMNDQVSLYMFGYFAIRCYDSKNFWYDLNKEHNLWSAFIDFALRMKKAREQFTFNVEKFRL